MPSLLLALTATALAHHTSGTSQVSAPAVTAPGSTEEVDELNLYAGTTYDLTAVDRRVHGEQREAAEDAVTLHRLTLTGGLALPGRRAVEVAAPVGWVHRAGNDDLGLGDLSLRARQGLGLLGDRLDLQVVAGLTAPTGRTADRASLSAIDVEGAADGSLTIATYDTRASLGAGSWSAQALAGVEAEVGPAAVRGHAVLSQPVSATAEGYRWGRDTTVGAMAVSPAVGPVRVEAGAQRRWHQADRGAHVDEETGETWAAGARQSSFLVGGVELAVSPRLRCRVDGRRVVSQRAEGIQLMASGGASAGCQLRAPVPRRARATEVSDDGGREAERSEAIDLEEASEAGGGVPSNIRR